MHICHEHKISGFIIHKKRIQRIAFAICTHSIKLLFLILLYSFAPYMYVCVCSEQKKKAVREALAMPSFEIHSFYVKKKIECF